MGGSRQKRQRDRQPTPLESLLSDSATVRAATDAFALAERPDARAWPFVASVGLHTVTLRWAFGAASTVPEPEAPWQAAGQDARVWIAERAELGAGGGSAGGVAGSATLAIGQFEETVVFVNTSRAPGPIVVSGGDGPDAAVLRELIARQSRDGADVAAAEYGGGPSGAWWPVEVDGDAIVLLGLAIARMFNPDEARLAGELMQRAATEYELRSTDEAERARDVPRLPAQPQAEPPTADRTGDAELAEWLRQVKASAAGSASATTALATTPEPMDAGLSATELRHTPTPAPTPSPAPTSADQDLDDWSAGFAVSSAEETAHR